VSDRDKSLSRSQPDLIRQLATEREQRSDLLLTENDLRVIAAESGNDFADLQLAVDEVSQVRKRKQSRVERPTAWKEALNAALLSGSIGTGLGMMNGVVRTLLETLSFHSETFFAFLLLVGGTAGVSFSVRGKLRHLIFLISIFGLWMGYALGFALAYPIIADQISRAGIIAAVVSAVLGSLIVEYRHAKRSKTPVSTISPSATAEGSEGSGIGNRE
jgi:hypothetical protein